MIIAHSTLENVDGGTMKRAEDVIKEYLRREGWDLIYRLNIRRTNEEHLITAGIDRDDWTISFTLDTHYEEKLRKICQEYTKICDTLRQIVRKGLGYHEVNVYGVGKHEFGHWEECPFDIDYFEEILEGTSRGLEAVGISKDEIEERTDAIANMFMDIIVNCIYGLKDEKFRHGEGIFYLKEAKPSKKVKMPLLIREGYPDGYALFVDTQSKLYQENKFLRDLAKRFGNYDKIKEDSKKILSILTAEHIAKKCFLGKVLDKEDKEFVIGLLRDRSKWREKAKEFAKIMSKYEIGMEIPDNPFSRKFRRDGKFRRDVIRRGIEKGHKMPYAKRFEIFDAIYEREAEEIVLKLFEEEINLQFPIFWMKRKRIKEGDRPENVAWEKTMFVDSSGKEEVWLYEKKVPYKIEEGRIPGPGSFADILFIFDVSESMGWSGEPMDGSKYDLAIRSVYGVKKYLERIGKAAHLRYGLIQFSTRTTWSGWIDYWEFGKIKRQLFEGYQEGVTGLEANKVEKALNSSQGNFFALMLSDAEMNVDVDEALTACKEIINRGNDFILLQFRSRDEFARELERGGAEVIDINKPDDLVGLILEKTKVKYRPR